MNIHLLNILRVVHIIAGVLWAGAAIAYFFFFKPTVKSIVPARGQFMQNLSERQRYPLFMKITSLLIILACGWLLWNTSGGLNEVWISNGSGLGFTLGAVMAILAYLNGIVSLSPCAERIGALGQQKATAGVPLAPAQLDELGRLERGLTRVEWWDFICRF